MKYTINSVLYDFPEDKIEDILKQYPNAVPVIDEDPGKKKPLQRDQSATVEVDPALEATELESVDISLELPKIEDLPQQTTGTSEDTTIVNNEAFYNPSKFFEEFTQSLSIETTNALERAKSITPTYEIYNFSPETTDEDIINYIKSQQNIANKTMQSPVMKEWAENYESFGKGFTGWVLATAATPSVLPAMAVQSTALNIASLQDPTVISSAAGGAAGGFAVGSTVPIVGQAIGTISGGFAGQAAAMETALTFATLLNQEIKGPLTVASVRAVLEDPAKLENLQQRALGRGASIGVVTAATASLAAGTGAQMIKKGFRPITTGAAQVGIGAAGGMTGEAIGIAAAGQEFDTAEIMFEGLTPGPTIIISAQNLTNVKDLIAEIELDNAVKPTEYTSPINPFQTDDVIVNETALELTRIKNSSQVLNRQLRRAVAKGEMSQEEADRISNQINEVQKVDKGLDYLNLTDKEKTEAINLTLLKSQVKKEEDTYGTNEQFDEVKKRISDRFATIIAPKVQDQLKKVESAAQDIKGVNVEIITSIEKAQEIIDQAGYTESANDVPAFVVQNPDTDVQTIYLNQPVAVKRAAVSAPAHELLHTILFKAASDGGTNMKNLSTALKGYLNRLDPNKIQGERYRERLELYKTKPDTVRDEEVLTLFTDALFTGDIQFDDNIFTKLGDAVSKVFKSLGLQAEFSSGRDVYNFLRDYTENIKEGKVTDQALTIAEGKYQTKGLLSEAPVEAEITTDRPTEEDFQGIINFSKLSQEEQSQKVQDIYNEFGVEGTMEIIDEYKGMVNKLVNKYRDVPGFTTYKDELISEIEIGKGGILDMINSYNPEKGVPLAAYINGLLPKRTIGIADRILKKEFEADVTEQRGVAAEESAEEVFLPDEQLPLIEIKEVLNLPDDLKEELELNVQERYQNVPLKQRTFKNLGDLSPETLGTLLDVRTSRITNLKDNFNTKELSSVMEFFKNNLELLRDVLPDGAIDQEAAVSTRVQGRATGVPDKLLRNKKLYTRQGRFSKGAGLDYYRKNDNITVENISEAIGLKEDGTYTFGPRDKESQRVKGFLSLISRMLSNQEVRKQQLGTAQESVDIATGKSQFMFSLDKGEENLNNNKKQAAKKNNKKLPKDKKAPKNATNEMVINNMAIEDAEINENLKKFYQSHDLNKEFNEILQKKYKLPKGKIYSRSRGESIGSSKGKFNFFIPYSAEDFVGLLYPTLSKGKLGDEQMAWYKLNLLDPYARAMSQVSTSRVAALNDFSQLQKDIGATPKNLRKKAPNSVYTNEESARVYIWSKYGYKIPGTKPVDVREMISTVVNNPELKEYADNVIQIMKGDLYIEPSKNWKVGSIQGDLLASINQIKRAKFLEQWQENVDIIFSEDNLSKLELLYGKKYVDALQDILRRMKTGRNRSSSSFGLGNWIETQLTGQIGTIMFLNQRSAVLQLLSATNFINLTDNNILKAMQTLSNPKQFAKDFNTLFNSDFLVERRKGLRYNVTEEDIIELSKRGGITGLLNKLLSAGFELTRIADGTAIALGGASFYRNRIKKYTKEGLSQKEAETKAFEDFRELAEEAQQSSRPDRISQEQASTLGRYILAFANTPAQYTRIIKKAASDLKNNRGDAKTNLSRIIYYTFLQNVMFSALQNGLFALLFENNEDTDEDVKERAVDIANSTANTFLRGMGVHGAIVAAVKDAGLQLYKESLKEDRKKEYEKAANYLLGVSPPIRSKYNKIARGYKDITYIEEDQYTDPFSPFYKAPANVIAGVTNAPTDRVLQKLENINDALSMDLALYERIFLLAGWPRWQLGLKNETDLERERKQTYKNVNQTKTKSTKIPSIDL